MAALVSQHQSPSRTRVHRSKRKSQAVSLAM